MEKQYLLKTIDCLDAFIKCLDDPKRTGYYGASANLYSLMFDSSGLLKSDFIIMLKPDTAKHFAEFMGPIKRTGSYFADSIQGYLVADIRSCLRDVKSDIEGCLEKITEEQAEEFHSQIISVCSMLQTNIACFDKKTKDGKKETIPEDHRNYYIRDLFDFKGLCVRGQEHQGISLNQKNSGEVDILVCHTPYQEKIYIEGMNLSCIDSKYISDHYEKLFLYDASIHKTNYLLSYVSFTEDFPAFCKRYMEFFKSYSGTTKCDSIEEEESQRAEIMVFKSTSTHNKKNVVTYHILIHMQSRIINTTNANKEEANPLEIS